MLHRLPRALPSATRIYAISQPQVVNVLQNLHGKECIGSVPVGEDGIVTGLETPHADDFPCAMDAEVGFASC